MEIRLLINRDKNGNATLNCLGIEDATKRKKKQVELFKNDVFFGRDKVNVFIEE